MKNIIILLLLALVFFAASGQQTTTVKVPPNKDTTVVRFTTTTTTTANTTTAFTTTTVPSDTVVTTPPPTAGYTLTFSSGYDTDADMKYQGNGQYGNGTISTTFYKTGPGSFYSRPQNVSSGIRSEVQYTEAKVNPTEGAIEYDVYYEVIVGSNGCSVQWHPNTSGSSGSPYLMHDGGKFTWVVWKGGGNTYYPTNVTIPSKQWVKMRIEYKFGSSGYLRHYMDGKELLNRSSIQMGDGSGQYLKVGYNGWDGNSVNSRIYYDNLRIYKKI